MKATADQTIELVRGGPEDGRVERVSASVVKALLPSRRDQAIHYLYQRTVRRTPAGHIAFEYRGRVAKTA